MATKPATPTLNRPVWPHWTLRPRQTSALTQRQHEKEAGIADGPDKIEHHVGLPTRPVGRTSSTAISTRKAKAAAPFGADELNRHGFAEPDDRGRPRTAPGTLPMPPRIAAAKSGSSRSKPMKGRICTSEPEHDAGRGGERAAERPGEADRRVDVDAGDASERRILADRPHGPADLRAREQEVHADHKRPPRADERTPSGPGVALRPKADRLAICSSRREIGGPGGEDEFEEGADRHRGPEARHHDARSARSCRATARTGAGREPSARPAVSAIARRAPRGIGARPNENGAAPPDPSRRAAPKGPSRAQRRIGAPRR